MASGIGKSVVSVENTEMQLQREGQISDNEGGQNGDMDNSTEVGETIQNTQNGQWNTVRHKKRRRQNTGSVDLERFENLNRDEQLSAIFATLIIFEQTQSKINTLEGHVRNNTQRVSEVERHTDVNTHGIKMLAYKQLDIETKMRRNNLIFRGLNEERNENIYNIINKFLSEQLNIDIDEVCIVEAYRLGSYKRAFNRVGRSGNDIRRPVLVTFRYPGDADSVLSLAYMLKGSIYSIDKDYPAEIATARRRIWPEFKRLRADNPQSRVLLKYPARIEVNGNTVVDLFPDWMEVMNRRSAFHSNYGVARAADQLQRSDRVIVDHDQQVYEADTESGEEYVRSNDPKQVHNYQRQTDMYEQNRPVNVQNNVRQTTNSNRSVNIQDNVRQTTNNNRQSQNVNNNTRVHKTSSVNGAPVANESPGNQQHVTSIGRDNIPQK